MQVFFLRRPMRDLARRNVARRFAQSAGEVQCAERRRSEAFERAAAITCRATRAEHERGYQVAIEPISDTRVLKRWSIRREGVL